MSSWWGPPGKHEAAEEHTRQYQACSWARAPQGGKPRATSKKPTVAPGNGGGATPYLEFADFAGGGGHAHGVLATPKEHVRLQTNMRARRQPVSPGAQQQTRTSFGVVGCSSDKKRGTAPQAKGGVPVCSSDEKCALGDRMVLEKPPRKGYQQENTPSAGRWPQS